MVPQVTGGHDSKRTDGREGAGLRPAPAAGIVNDFSVASARQIEALHEHIAGFDLAVPGVAITVRPPLLIAIAGVAIRLIVAMT
jgi:hypothetical protein